LLLLAFAFFCLLCCLLSLACACFCLLLLAFACICLLLLAFACFCLFLLVSACFFACLKIFSFPILSRALKKHCILHMKTFNLEHLWSDPGNLCSEPYPSCQFYTCVQHARNTSATHVQHTCNTRATRVQHACNTRATCTEITPLLKRNSSCGMFLFKKN